MALSPEDVQQIVNRLKAVDTQTLIYQTIAADRIGKRLSSEEISRKIDIAEQLAKQLVHHYKDTLKLETVEQLVAYLKLNVEFREEKIEEYFAIIGFFESPNRIVVNNVYRQNDAFWLARGLPECTFERWSQVVIAHEAFHAIQEQKKLDLSEFETELWQFAGFKKRSPITALIEVVANYFAQYYTGFELYPALLDNVALLPLYPEAVSEQVSSLS